MSKISHIMVEEMQGPKKHGQMFHPHSIIILAQVEYFYIDIYYFNFGGEEVTATHHCGQGG